jgi:hypothetical protein
MRAGLTKSRTQPARFCSFTWTSSNAEPATILGLADPLIGCLAGGDPAEPAASESDLDPGPSLSFPNASSSQPGYRHCSRSRALTLCASRTERASPDGHTVVVVASGGTTGMLLGAALQPHIATKVWPTGGDADVGSEAPPPKKIKLQEVTLSDQLPSSVVATLESLVVEHPGLELLTVTSRKGGWGVYARHAGIDAVLQGKQRTPEAAIRYIQKWLLQAALEPVEPTIESALGSIEPSEWVDCSLMCGWLWSNV